MRRGRIKISPGFVLMAGLLIYWEGGGLLAPALMAAMLHELGHYGAMRIFGGELRALRLTAAGAEMELSSRNPLPYVAECIVIAAGPLVNLICALICANLPEAFSWGYLHAGVHLSLGLFNLLPVRPLDGGNLLALSLSAVLGVDRGQQAARMLGLALSAALALAGCALFLSKQVNVSFLVCGIWLFLRNAKKT